MNRRTLANRAALAGLLLTGISVSGPVFASDSGSEFATCSSENSAENSAGLDLATPTDTDDSARVSIARSGTDHQAAIQATKTNAIRLEQHGRGHNLSSIQTGQDGYVIIDQQGSAASAEIAQAGNCNFIQLGQGGSGNRANISQSGNGNTAIIRQGAATHKSSIKHLGKE